MNARRGFTLIELMVGLVLVTRGRRGHLRAAGAESTRRSLAVGARRTSGQRPHRHGRRGQRAARDRIRLHPGDCRSRRRRIRESRSAGHGTGPRWSTRPCVESDSPARSPASGQVRLQRTTLLGLRPPEAGDSLTAYVEGNPDTGADDAWVHGVVTARGGGICDDGSPAVTLTMTFVGSAARGRSCSNVRRWPGALLRADGAALLPVGRQVWLGLRSVSAGGTIEPMLGPLSGRHRLREDVTFVYRDATASPPPSRTTSGASG